jgi:hypothetical protein
MADRIGLIHRPSLKTAFCKSFNVLHNSGGDPELSTCALPGLYRRIEVAIFLAVVLAVAGAGTCASSVG